MKNKANWIEHFWLIIWIKMWNELTFDYFYNFFISEITSLKEKLSFFKIQANLLKFKNSVTVGSVTVGDYCNEFVMSKAM